MASTSAPTLWLKEGHTLRGRDVLPVIMRIVDAQGVVPESLASVSRKYPLAAYSMEDLEQECKKLTGYELAVSWPYFDLI
jgi:hypothetical protein